MGTGKSTLLAGMIVADIQCGEGICLIDPDGDLYKDVLQRIPASRADDVVLVDPTDREWPVGLNPLEVHSAQERHFVIDAFVSAMERMGDLIASAHIFAGRPKPDHAVADLGGVIFVKVRIGGSLITNTHFSTMKAVERLLGSASCFGTYTTEFIRFSEAAENSVPVWMHASPNASRVAAKGEYQSITQEVLQRF